MRARNLLSVKEKQRNSHIYFGLAQKVNLFGPNFKVWLQSCQVVAKETPLEYVTALGLRPDSSNHQLQINFCCLIAKYYICGPCRLNKMFSRIKRLLILYLKHIYEMGKIQLQSL